MRYAGKRYCRTTEAINCLAVDRLHSVFDIGFVEVENISNNPINSDSQKRYSFPTLLLVADYGLALDGRVGFAL